MYLAQAKIDEGWVPRVYKNYKGLPTLGYGHLVTPDTQKTLVGIGVPKERARRILSDKPGTRAESMTMAEGEALLRHNISKKEKELRYMINYDKLTNSQKTGLLGLRFRGDFAMYDNPRSRKLSKEYKHARAGRYDLAAREMRRRVKNAPIGVRKRVDLHTQALLSKPTPSKKKGLGAAAVLLLLGGATAARLIKSRRKNTSPVVLNNTPPVVLNNTPSVVSTHVLNNTPPVVSTHVQKPCAPGKTRNPKTGRCVADDNKKPCAPGKTRNPKTGRCVADNNKKPCAPGKTRNPKTGRCVANNGKTRNPT
jgi:GH24 family phage-related lysozyme (muramidase)